MTSARHYVHVKCGPITVGSVRVYRDKVGAIDLIVEGMVTCVHGEDSRGDTYHYGAKVERVLHGETEELWNDSLTNEEEERAVQELCATAYRKWEAT